MDTGRAGRAGRAVNPLTRETLRDSGEVVREFDARSAAQVLGAFIGAIFLVFFLAAFVPWLLSNGMTAAVEGMMHQVGFDDFRANTLGDWILVLFVGAVFTAFIVALSVGILMLYNVLSKRTGMGMRTVAEIVPADEPPAIEARPAKRASAAKKSSTTKKRAGSGGKSTRSTKRSSSTRRR